MTQAEQAEVPHRGSQSAPGGVVITTLALGGTLVSLQQTLILPVLPDLPHLLGTTSDNASWLITATLLAGAVSLPTMSRLADMYGKKRMILLALGIMVAGSTLGALGGSLALVVLARALQGVGVALIPVGIALMRDNLPQERLHLGVALMSATLAIGGGAGLPLAGLIVEHLGWHSIFWVTGAAGVLMLLGVAVIVPESPVRSRGRFDYPGALLLALALTALLVGLTKAPEWGWASPRIVGLGVGCLTMLAMWIPVELRRPHPLVDIRVAARPAVSLVNVAAVLLGFAMFANMLVTTQLLQRPVSTGYGLGLDILHTGVWMAPGSVAFGVTAPLAAVVSRRFGPLVTLLIGAVTMACSYTARVFLSHELWQIVAGSILVSAATSMTYAAMPTLIMRAVPVHETASANGLNALLRSIGTSLSSAAMVAFTTVGIVEVGGDALASLGALTAVFWSAAGASTIAAAVTVPLFWAGRGQNAGPHFRHS